VIQFVERWIPICTPISANYAVAAAAAAAAAVTVVAAAVSAVAASWGD